MRLHDAVAVVGPPADSLFIHTFHLFAVRLIIVRIYAYLSALMDQLHRMHSKSDGAYRVYV